MNKTQHAIAGFAAAACLAAAGFLGLAGAAGAQAHADAGPRTAHIDMKYYQSAPQETPRPQGAGAAPPAASASPEAGSRPGTHSGALMRPRHPVPVVRHVLYQDIAELHGPRPAWHANFQRHRLELHRVGNVFQAAVVQRAGWRQVRTPLFRVSTDMIMQGRVHYGQTFLYQNGPYTLEVALGDIFVLGGRITGMEFHVVLYQEWHDPFARYYSGPAPGRPAPGPWAGAAPDRTQVPDAATNRSAGEAAPAPRTQGRASGPPAAEAF